MEVTVQLAEALSLKDKEGAEEELEVLETQHQLLLEALAKLMRQQVHL
jgi:hypothetical protein